MNIRTRLYVALLSLTTQACVSLKAVTPPTMEEGRSWIIDAPQNVSFINGGTIKHFAAGPYKTSGMTFDEFSSKDKKTVWSDSSFSKDGDTQWTGFALTKDGKKLSSARCRQFISSTKYQRGNNAFSMKSGEVFCDIEEGRDRYLMTFSKSVPALRRSGEDGPHFTMSWSNSVAPESSSPLKTGLLFYKKKNSKPFAWLKTMQDGEPSRLLLGKNLTRDDETMVVTTAFAYLAYIEFGR